MSFAVAKNAKKGMRNKKYNVAIEKIFQHIVIRGK
jgi:Leu/Phe-tRNA-protein transferase